MTYFDEVVYQSKRVPRAYRFQDTFQVLSLQPPYVACPLQESAFETSITLPCANILARELQYFVNTLTISRSLLRLPSRSPYQFPNQVPSFASGGQRQKR